MDIKHNERNELLKVIFQGNSKQGAKSYDNQGEQGQVGKECVQKVLI